MRLLSNDEVGRLDKPTPAHRTDRFGRDTELLCVRCWRMLRTMIDDEFASTVVDMALKPLRRLAEPELG